VAPRNPALRVIERILFRPLTRPERSDTPRFETLPAIPELPNFDELCRCSVGAV
jgi:hypothetical protein